MTREELETEKISSIQNYQQGLQNRDLLEQTVQIQNYLSELANIEYEKEYQNFLEQLEIGEDGTVFAPTSPVSPCRYSLNELLQHIFSLSYYRLEDMVLKYNLHKTEEEIKTEMINSSWVEFSKFLTYSINARRVLTDMNYKKGDQVVFNEYGLEIYKNPKDNSIINFKDFIKESDDEQEAFCGIYTTFLTTEILQKKYKALAFKVTPLEIGYAFTIKNTKRIQWSDLSTLTPREQEAFYGASAQESQGWVPVDIIGNKKGACQKCKKY